MSYISELRHLNFRRQRSSFPNSIHSIYATDNVSNVCTERHYIINLVIVDATGARMQVCNGPEQKLINSHTTFDVIRIPVIS